MLQSQERSTQCNAKGTPPAKGLRIRDYDLVDAVGSPIQLSSFRGRRNLVVLFVGTREHGESIAGRLMSFEREFAEKNAQVIVIVANDPAWVSGSDCILVASDIAGEAHKEIGEGGAHRTHACYVTDQFGEVYAALPEIPAMEEILRWLDYINAQCPECEPPEWPPE